MTTKEAIAIIKANKDGMAKLVQDAIEVLHPELKESEGERIRKYIIEFIALSDNPRKDEMLAYLENQKPAEWSEEDKEMMQNIITGLEAQIHLIYAHDEQGKAQMKARINFLMSLPERFSLQPKQEWSEEDEKILEGIILDYEGEIENLSDDVCDELVRPVYEQRISWLKSLRPQPHWKHLSEKDTFIRDRCYATIRDSELSDEEKEWIFDFLKRCEPQPRWKPSKEQMIVLLNAGNGNYLSGKHMQVLRDLYNDLKKLL